MPSSPPTATTADVAALVPERVGAAGGDFTVGTTPTAAQVASLIAQIVQEVQAVVGPVVDDTLAAYATLTVAEGVAAQVELQFTDELVARDATSKYAEFRAAYIGDYDKTAKIGGKLKILADAQDAIAAGSQPGVSDFQQPWATFPDPQQQIAGHVRTTLTEPW